MRKHRILDGSTGEITVVPFTKKEEAAADKREAAAVAKLYKDNSDEGRIAKAFTSSDKDIVLKSALHEIMSRLSELEANGKVRQADFDKWLTDKLPGKSI